MTQESPVVLGMIERILAQVQNFSGEKVVMSRQDLCSNCVTKGKSRRLQKRYGLRDQGYTAGQFLEWDFKSLGMDWDGEGGTKGPVCRCNQAGPEESLDLGGHY